jgi:archaellum component FlaG (FlaF/FlaG flagellin family)
MDNNAQRKVAPVHTSDDAALNIFPSESPTAKLRPPTTRSMWLVGGATVCLAAAIGAAFWLNARASAAAATGSVTVESEPSGAHVFVDGTARGATPITIALVEGKHQLRLEQGTRTQQIPLAIKADTTVVHHITWPVETASASVAATATGSLRIVSEPSAATVTIDAIDRGSTPLTVAGLSVGQHDVVVRSGGKTQRRTLQVEANTTTSLVLSGVESGTPSGWLSATASAPLRIFESGKLVGSTESDRIMLPAGEHTFEFSSDALGFSATRTLNIGAGQTSSVVLPMPQVIVSLNAVPWAQVWVDGQALGATPIGDFKTTVGAHEVIFRHPQFGERKQTVVVTAKGPNRISADMTKP